MALLKCPECGHNVSDKAETCPGCGVKVSYILSQQKDGKDAKAGNKGGNKRQETESKPRKGRSLTVFLVSLLIAGALCGVGWYFYKDAQRQKENSEYTNAMQSQDPLVMQMYLARYADAPQEHRDSVNARMTMLTQLDNDWHNAVVSGARSELEKYIAAHPDSPHRGEALNKIDSIDYATARRLGTVQAYEDYLKQHPDGKFSLAAQDFIDEKKKEEMQAVMDSTATANGQSV